jgi:phage baseplate assembly protein gpV
MGGEMRTAAILLLMLICTAFPSMTVAKTITYYLDGARVEYEAKARKGYLAQ